MISHNFKIICIAAILLLFTTAVMVVPYSGNSWARGQTNASPAHTEQWQKWEKSHHQKSMLVANTDNILGNFDDAEITINGIRTEFFKKSGSYWVRTEDVIGIPKEFEIEYAFGFEPLQQYLVKTENGKYQVLPFSWDSRDAERGGQRWFHIYGDDHIAVNDRLHWTGPLQNWNGMCADCHSTGLKRNYNTETDQFKTSWQSANVSCASCHSKDDYSDFNTPSDDSGWEFIEASKSALWSGKPRPSAEIEVCAACHSRRAPITDGFRADAKFLDQFMPTLIQPPEYFPDGQVKGEDYVWGSFLQSKMYSKGVLCSDCHDPHSLELKASGNALCGQCHLPTHFDTPDHHNHKIGSTGAQCVNCHMPETTFMQIDARNDHSFRIPRPDLNQKTASPDACTSCHATMTSQQASQTIENWYGENTGTPAHYGEILNDVLMNEIGAEENLKRLIYDQDMPVIIRASAFSLLGHYPNEDTLSHVRAGLNSQEPLIRLGAIRSTGFLPPAQRETLLSPLLDDEYKAIRIEAFNGIGNADAADKAKNEYLEAAEQSMWRGEGRYNLALFHQRNGEIEEATKLYLSAQKIDPYFSASYVNLADLFRAQGNENMNGQIVDRGLSLMPDDPALNFSKALHLVRTQRAGEALPYLDQAVRYAPDNTRYAYVYAVALKDLGEDDKAISVLKNANRVTKNNPDIIFLLLDLNRAKGDWKEALKYAENLSKLLPGNPTISRVITDLKQKVGNFN